MSIETKKNHIFIQFLKYQKNISILKTKSIALSNSFAKNTNYLCYCYPSAMTTNQRNSSEIISRITFITISHQQNPSMTNFSHWHITQFNMKLTISLKRTSLLYSSIAVLTLSFLRTFFIVLKWTHRCSQSSQWSFKKSTIFLSKWPASWRT